MCQYFWRIFFGCIHHFWTYCMHQKLDSMPRFFSYKYQTHISTKLESNWIEKIYINIQKNRSYYSFFYFNSIWFKLKWFRGVQRWVSGSFFVFPNAWTMDIKVNDSLKRFGNYGNHGDYHCGWSWEWRVKVKSEKWKGEKWMI